MGPVWGRHIGFPADQKRPVHVGTVPPCDPQAHSVLSPGTLPSSFLGERGPASSTECPPSPWRWPLSTGGRSLVVAGLMWPESAECLSVCFCHMFPHNWVQMMRFGFGRSTTDAKLCLLVCFCFCNTHLIRWSDWIFLTTGDFNFIIWLRWSLARFSNVKSFCSLSFSPQ